MGRQRDTVDCNVHTETGSNEENANCEDEEDPSEDELDEEHNFEEESNEEGETCEEVSEEEDSQEEELDEEHIGVHSEEDLSERFVTRSSSNSDDEECELGSKPSSSEKKRRSADESQGYPQKKQKQVEDRRLELYSYSTSTVLKGKPNSSISNEKIAEKENTGSYGKKKRSRWDIQPETCRAETGSDLAAKKRKTRWANDDAQLKLLGPLKLPDFVKSLVGDTSIDPVIQKLNSELIEINSKLNAHKLVHEQPPNLDESGIRLNKRDKKLIKRRQEIISELIKRNPTFDSPPDRKPQKLYKKLYIPLKEYPGYNFVGQIIGPRGNTQKRMEMETGAKILLRGKGSTKERFLKHKDTRVKSSDEDLHVYIEADTQKSLDAAVQLVEKLLVPVEEGRNEHKRAQLRELAALNGKLRAGSSKIQNTTSRASFPCDICGNTMHPTAACPLIASNPGTGKSEKFLADLGCNGVAPFIYPPLPSSRSTLMANQQSHVLAPSNSMPLKNMDETKLFVGYLPQSTNVAELKELFSPFGCISEAVVVRDKTTGFSKGYGFVKYTDSVSAAAAVVSMNGYRIKRKMLSVQIARQPSSEVKSCILPGAPINFSNLPTHPCSAAISQGNPGVMTWPGPPGSMLAETQSSFLENICFMSPAGSISGPSLSIGTSGQNFVSPMIPHTVACSKELEQFPGYLKSVESSKELEQFPRYLKNVEYSQELERFPGYLKSVDVQDQLHCFTYFKRPSSEHVHPAHTCDSYRASFAHLTPSP